MYNNLFTIQCIIIYLLSSLAKENWIAAVKAADHLHGILLDPDNVRKLEPVGLSFVQHMWALSDAVCICKIF